MKIYTKNGDKGQTSLFGGEKVSKCALRVEAYGTVDELNANIGLLRDNCAFPDIKDELLCIQRSLFSIQSLLAAVEPDKYDFLPRLKEEGVYFIEDAIDRMQDELPPFKAFIIPGGHPLVSQAHVSRCVCRRAERGVVALAQTETIDMVLIRYLNRLSDYLFVLSRYFSLRLHVAEICWEKD